MKINRHGKAKILTPDEIKLLFNQGLVDLRDKALFGVCLYCACRIREACTLICEDVYQPSGKIRDGLVIRKANTKGKLATRYIPIIEDLRHLLTLYHSDHEVYLFPGRYGRGHINPDTAGRILREACNSLNIQGVSTHSFRRTALTQMSNAGIPLRVIQEISGHRNLDQLQKYLEVEEDQVKGAVASLSLLSFVENHPQPPTRNPINDEASI